MGLRIPQNQAVTSKYTSGKEYMFNSTYREYIGYYYELNQKLFAGKEFSTSAPEIIKIDSSKVNKLLTNPSTYTYGKISGIKMNDNNISTLPSSTDNIYDKGGEEFIRFFCQKENQTPILIKEISEDTYKSLQNNPLYKTTYIGNYNDSKHNIDDANKEMPGLKTFLLG